MDELRRKNSSLAKEVERLSTQAEKPLEHQSLSVSSRHVLDGLDWWMD